MQLVSVEDSDMASGMTDDAIQHIVDDYKEKRARNSSLGGLGGATKQLENRFVHFVRGTKGSYN